MPENAKKGCFCPYSKAKLKSSFLAMTTHSQWPAGQLASGQWPQHKDLLMRSTLHSHRGVLMCLFVCFLHQLKVGKTSLGSDQFYGGGGTSSILKLLLLLMDRTSYRLLQTCYRLLQTGPPPTNENKSKCLSMELVLPTVKQNKPV